MYFDELLKYERDFPFPHSSKTYLFSLHFKNCLLEIRTNSAGIADSVISLYRTIIARKGNKTTGITPVKYCHFENKGRYIITRNGKLAYSCGDFSQAVSRFDWMLMSDIVDHHRHIPIIHASAVVLDGKAIVFAGNSGSGKSSFALLMGLEGNAFISDDIILADKGISGVPRAICLAETYSKDFIGKEVPQIKGLKRGMIYVYIDPCHINIEINNAVLPISHIIFLERCSKGYKLKELTPVTTVQCLVANLFDTIHYFQEKLDILINLTGQVKGAHLTWCDMSSAIKEVKAFACSG